MKRGVVLGLFVAAKAIEDGNWHWDGHAQNDEYVLLITIENDRRDFVCVKHFGML